MASAGGMVTASDARAQGVNFATADTAAAYAAFAQRREPSFTGRWALSNFGVEPHSGEKQSE